MARKGPNKYQRAAQRELPDVERLAHGGAREEQRRGVSWWVRDVPSSRAVKLYRCPDCGQDIPLRQAHIVAWRADSVLGDARALGERRHYHAHCWRIR